MDQQQAGASRREGQEQQGPQSAQQAPPSQASPMPPGGRGSEVAGAHGAAGSADQERQRAVSREGGTGMQRTGGRQGPGTAVSRGQGQPSLLPAFMSSPGLMASAFMSNPFAFAQAMSQEMDRLFSSYGGAEPGSGLASYGGRGQPSGAAAAGRGLGQWVPPLEVRQHGNELVVSADLPGLAPDDVHIDVEDGVLTISGERRQSSEDRHEGFYRSERSYGAFSRSIALPDGVDEEQVQARFDHGVLEVTVPLPTQRARGRRVQIQAGGGHAAAGQRAPEGSVGAQGSGSSMGRGHDAGSRGAP